MSPVEVLVGMAQQAVEDGKGAELDFPEWPGADAGETARLVVGSDGSVYAKVRVGDAVVRRFAVRTSVDAVSGKTVSLPDLGALAPVQASAFELAAVRIQGKGRK